MNINFFPDITIPSNTGSLTTAEQALNAKNKCGYAGGGVVAIIEGKVIPAKGEYKEYELFFANGSKVNAETALFRFNNGLTVAELNKELTPGAPYGVAGTCSEQEYHKLTSLIASYIDATGYMMSEGGKVYDVATLDTEIPYDFKPIPPNGEGSYTVKLKGNVATKAGFWVNAAFLLYMAENFGLSGYKAFLDTRNVSPS